MSNESEDTDMTSDILIYNILNQTTDPVIKKCNLKFIDRSVPAQEDDTIYIASIDLESRPGTLDYDEFVSLVNIYVKTKDTDYIESSRFLRTVIKHIKKELRKNSECQHRRIRFRNSKYEYGSTYTLKGLHLLVQLLEWEKVDPEDEDTFDNICGIDTEDIIIN